MNGRKAGWTRQLDDELVITPRRALKEGRRFEVSVRYERVPEQFVVPAAAGRRLS